MTHMSGDAVNLQSGTAKAEFSKAKWSDTWSVEGVWPVHQALSDRSDNWPGNYTEPIRQQRIPRRHLVPTGPWQFSSRSDATLSVCLRGAWMFSFCGFRRPCGVIWRFPLPWRRDLRPPLGWPALVAFPLRTRSQVCPHMGKGPTALAPSTLRSKPSASRAEVLCVD